MKAISVHDPDDHHHPGHGVVLACWPNIVMSHIGIDLKSKELPGH
jgi:hypothetical protein